MLRGHRTFLLAVGAILALHGLAILAVWWIHRDVDGAGPVDARPPQAQAPALAAEPSAPAPARVAAPLPAPLPAPYRPAPGAPVPGEEVGPPPDPAVVEAAPVWKPGDPQFDPSPAATAEADAFARHQAEMAEQLKAMPPARPVPTTQR